MSDQPKLPGRVSTVWGALAANYFRGPRWTVAFAVLLTCVFGLLAGWFEVCSVETAGTTVTRTCNGPSITDAGAVAIAFLIVLLLAPDMSEVGVFGVSLKRRLWQQRKKRPNR
jgi:hypothetical protein